MLVSNGPSSENDQIFGKYELRQELAGGGMGEIFLAEDHSAQNVSRFVIVKSLAPKLAKSARAVERFLDEARIASLLAHPNIICIHEVGEWHGRYYIVMEYIDGPTISELTQRGLESDCLLPDFFSASVICEVAQALDYAHRARDKEGQDLRLVHRDVSPQNIMIGSDGVPKVLDFGIAKAVSNTVNTTTGKVSGKIRYMAPEQVRSETLDDRGDQFALGVVFWEMLTHRRLFGAEPDVSARIVERPVPPPSSINSQVSKAIDDVVIKMMAFDRKNRFENHTAVVQALQKLLKGAEQDYSAAARAAFMRSNLGIIFRSAESFQLSSEAIELEALPTPSPDQDDDLTKPVSNPIPIAKNAREAVSKPSWWYSVLGLLFVLTMLIAYLATGQN